MTDEDDYIDDDNGRWKCNHKGADGLSDCDGDIEANPKLFLELDADGTWSIVGVGDDFARVTCDSEEHDQLSRILDKSLTAFLEETFPGCTWQGSGGLVSEED